MKYKTLCRLLVKLTGVFYLAQSLQYLPQTIRDAWKMAERGFFTFYDSYNLYYFIGSLAAGGVLLLGNRWIVDRLIPSNRPYCHDCAYDLTGAAGHLCPECGTPFRAEPATEPHH